MKDLAHDEIEILSKCVFKPSRVFTFCEGACLLCRCTEMCGINECGCNELLCVCDCPCHPNPPTGTAKMNPYTAIYNQGGVLEYASTLLIDGVILAVSPEL
jgi:hypothetical protein